MVTGRRFLLWSVLAGVGVLAFPMHASFGQGMVQGPNNPSTLTNTAGPFVKPWTSPGNASASDDIDATATVTAPLQETDFLHATGFGFTIPADRVVRRITVKVEGRANTSISTARVRLLKNGNPVGTPMVMNFPNSATDGTVIFNDQDEFPYGGTVNFTTPITLWGSTFTPAQINAANFGVRLDCETLTGSTVTFEVDNIRVWVYTFPTVPASDYSGLLLTTGALLFAGAFFAWRRLRVSRASK